jgi:hypothetical protein
MDSVLMILPQVHLRNVYSNQTNCSISTKLSQKAFPPFVPLSSSSHLEDGLYLKQLILSDSTTPSLTVSGPSP